MLTYYVTNTNINSKFMSHKLTTNGQNRISVFPLDFILL